MANSVLDDLGPLYHSYRIFGVHNQQLPGIFELNQRSKGPIIQAYIQYALAKCKTTVDTPVTFAEMFCADGYYAMLARHFGAASSVGIDNGRDPHFELAPKIAERLGLDSVRFVKMEANDVDQLAPVDVVANVGGLYHVSNPKEVLVKSYHVAKQFLIVQTAVSLANDDEDYFETPAPGWTWGSRYNARSFLKMVSGLGWEILDIHINALEGNTALEDRGSVYLLIRKG